jgi:hypothetical protein
MIKPKLRLGFTDYYPTLDEFFLDTLSSRFDIIRDDEHPTYLIFADETFGKNNLNYDHNKVIKIFFTGENRRPQNYVCHFAITFDHLDSDRFYRLPLYILDNWNAEHMGLTSLYEANTNRTFTTDDWHKRTEFCGFISGNGGSLDRNNMFHILSEYKRVDSAGPLFNNIGHIIPRGHEAQKHKMEFLSKYRFNLCYENSSYPGYVTEKLPHAFVSGTIPIYWGSPVVDVDFNTDAFVNRHDFETDADMVKYIIEIDNNMYLWLEIMNRPFFNPKNKFIDLDRFRNWFIRNVYRG